jgi:hypothetical protein
VRYPDHCRFGAGWFFGFDVHSLFEFVLQGGPLWTKPVTKVIFLTVWMQLHHHVKKVTNFSKNHFCPGGMAPPLGKRSVRAVRDTMLADYLAPGVNTTLCIAYHPPIAVSPCLLTLPFSNVFTNTLTLWPTVNVQWNRFIGYTLASGLQCSWWHCENLSLRSFYLNL